MQRFILGFLSILCGVTLFYINHFEKSYLDNHTLMYTLYLSIFILILLHFKIYKK